MLKTLKLHKPLTLLFVMLLSTSVIAGTEQAFTVAKPIVFKPGNAKFKAQLSKIEDAKDVMDGRYLVGTADLNDDGRMEIILQSNDSMYCGSGGCLTVVIEQPKATSSQTYTLLSQNLGSSLAVTNEKVGNYRALASLMEDGKIQIADKKGTPLNGKQMVYAMNNASPTASVTKAEAETPTTNPQASTVAATLNKSAPSIAGISLGITADEAKRIMTAHFKTYSKQADPIGEVAFVGAPSANTAPFVWQLIAESREGDNAIKTIQRDNIVVTLSPPPNARVVKIKREIRFTIGNEVDIGSLHAQLNTKYGQSTGNAGGSFWFFDRTGRSVKAPAAIKSEGNCKVINSNSELNNIFNNINFYKKGQAIFGLNPACGVVFELAPASNLKGPTTIAYTGLLDSNGFLNAIVDGFAYLNGQSDAAANQEADKAKKRAVPNL